MSQFTLLKESDDYPTVSQLLGEKLMGLPGMILAPVVLHYIKVEASRRTVAGHVSPAESTAAP